MPHLQQGSFVEQYCEAMVQEMLKEELEIPVYNIEDLLPKTQQKEH